MGFVKKVYDGISGKTGAKAAKEAGQMQADSSKYAADIAQKQFEQTRQDQMPWMDAGKKALGGLDQMLYGDPSEFMNDPSYQFRKQQGMDGIESSAAASGGLLSGAALKSLNRYNSDLASQEYGNAFNRLSGVAGTGQTTATNLGQFGANNAMNQGNALIAGANAQANGIVGAANSRQQGFNNILNLGMKAGGMFI